MMCVLLVDLMSHTDPAMVTLTSFMLVLQGGKVSERDEIQ